MKKLLFSRSQKKHFSDTVVRIGKNNLGFSLVELIVIIAIMAVLVAIAIPVLGVFIEKAKINNDKQTVADINYAINIGGQSMMYPIDVAQVSANGLQVPVGFIILTSGTDKNGNTVEKFQVLGNETNKAAINGILNDALGSEYLQSSLHYDGWGNSTDVPDLYANATDLYGKVQTLSNLVVSLGQGDPNHKNGVEVVASVSTLVYDKYTENQFVEQWCKTKAVEETFGFSPSIPAEQEAYLAIRRAYNEAVASYIGNNTPTTHDTFELVSSGFIIKQYSKGGAKTAASATHANHIASCGAVFVSDTLVVPDVVGKHLFDSKGGNDPLGARNAITAVFGSKNVLDDETQWCETCANAVAAYDVTETAKNDARAFYQMMVTMYETKDEALAHAAQNQGDQWGYYTNTVESFSDVYVELKTKTENLDNCIVITVYQNSDGLLFTECNTPGISDN